MKKKINIIIQARLQSSRLKRKIMLEINDKPLLFYMVERLKNVKDINKIILSTSEYSKNLSLIEYSKTLGIDVYSENSSHEDDLCSRFFNTCLHYPCDSFVKINGDCPIPEINIIKKMISIYRDNNYIDYISNKKDSWPLGYSVELINFDCLRWCNENLKDESEREFFATKISELQNIFHIKNIPNRFNFKFTNHLMVDTYDDFKIIKTIFEKLYIKKKLFNFRDIENHFKLTH